MLAPWELSIDEFLMALYRRYFSAKEAVEAILTRYDALGDALNAFISILPEYALEQAKHVDDRLASGAALRALEGIPIVLDDSIAVSGIRTTCGSQLLSDFYPPYDATLTKRLKDAGAIILGKTNTDEFGLGHSTENSCYGPSRNPWSTDRSAGGPCGGLAAAVAAGFGLAGVGVDSIGGILIPASLTNLVGFRPTFGRISRYGVISPSSSLAEAGIIGKQVSDVARIFEVIAGYDDHDATTLRVAVPNTSENLFHALPWSDVRIALIQNAHAEPSVTGKIDEALLCFAKEGAVISKQDLKTLKYTIAVSYIISAAEASSNLARFSMLDDQSRSRLGGLSRKTKAFLKLGAYVLSANYYDAYYIKVGKVRNLLSRELDDCFENSDLAVLPTLPIDRISLGAEDPIRDFAIEAIPVVPGLAGIPAVTMPCGFANDECPVGMLLCSAPKNESRLLRIAAAYEDLNSWQRFRPLDLFKQRDLSKVMSTHSFFVGEVDEQELQLEAKARLSSFQYVLQTLDPFIEVEGGLSLPTIHFPADGSLVFGDRVKVECSVSFPPGDCQILAEINESKEVPLPLTSRDKTSATFSSEVGFEEGENLLRVKVISVPTRMIMSDTIHFTLQNKQVQVFLSHSSADKEFVERLAIDLRKYGVTVWYSAWELKVGDSIVERINNAIGEADYFVVVLSPHSVVSRWVKEELNAATFKMVEGKGARILPVMIEDCELPSLLEHRLYADFRGDFGFAFKQLVMSIAQS